MTWWVCMLMTPINELNQCRNEPQAEVCQIDSNAAVAEIVFPRVSDRVRESFRHCHFLRNNLWSENIASGVFERAMNFDFGERLKERIRLFIEWIQWHNSIAREVIRPIFTRKLDFNDRNNRNKDSMNLFTSASHVYAYAKLGNAKEFNLKFTTHLWYAQFKFLV